MKTIKGLSIVVALLFLVNMLNTFTMLYLTYKDSNIINGSIGLSICSLVSTISLALLFLGLLDIIKGGYFNKSSPRYFRASGMLLILTSIGNLFIYISQNTSNTIAPIYDGIVGSSLVLLIAIGLIAIAKILQEGSVLKTENDLTI